MANIQVAGASSRGFREYRKGNWTIEETMVLIEAKKLHEERRLIMKRDQTSSGSSNIEVGGLMNMVRSKPAAAAELRWKWIEDYCWTKNCLRSQNQCNDKWDNLMRDFKKVRDYENSCSNNVRSSECCSYWKMDRRERKDRNLPSNILPQIYEALVQVMEKKGGQRGVNVNVMLDVAGGCGSSCAATTTTSSINPNISFVMQTPPTSILQQQQQYLASQPLHLPLSAPVAALPLPPPQLPLPTVDNTETSSDHGQTNNSSDTPSKRRRRGRRISHAITKSAAVIAEAVQASEESEERRHRDLMSVQQRRLQIEETKAEIHKQGINGLTDAINKLANSIHALASHRNQPPPSAPNP